MKSDQQTIKLTLLFLLLFILLGGVLLTFYSGIEFSLLINQFSSPSLDLFFGGITILGLGGLLFLFALLFLFINYYHSILFMGVLSLSGILSYLLKRVLFKDFMRPLHYMGDMNLRFPEGMEMHYKYSFPSGHSMTIFAAITLLFWMNRKPAIALINICIGLLVGLSRIYLFQHFLLDVYWGIIIGITEALLVVFLFEKYWKLHKVPVLQTSLLHPIKKILLKTSK